MGIGGQNFSASNVNTGAAADKPANPTVGDEYNSTDTKTKEVCFTEGVWTDLQYILTAAKIGIADPSLSYVGGGTFAGNGTANRAIPHNLSSTPLFIYICAVVGSSGRSNILGEDTGKIICVDIGTAYAVTVVDATNFYVGNAASYAATGNDAASTYKWMAFI